MRLNRSLPSRLRGYRRYGAALFVLVGSVACDIQVREGGDVKVGMFSARATQEWVRTYPLSAGGQVEIANLNGPIAVTEGSAGSSLEVRATITARALTDGGAKDMLARGKIEETVSPERVKVETVIPRGTHGSYEVRYELRVPPGALAQISTTNGSAKATALTGKLKASVVNGGVDLTEMAGAIDAAVVNGSLSVTLAKVVAPVRLETTNGRLMLTLPSASQATLTARVVNGSFTVTGLPVTQPGQQRIKNLEATLNGGGPVVDLRATNGRVTITGTP